MTTTIRSERKGNYEVSVEIDKLGIYEVRLVRLWNECEGRIEKSNRTIERKNALATYRRYLKEI